jgi:hypothetical protein
VADARKYIGKCFVCLTPTNCDFQEKACGFITSVARSSVKVCPIRPSLSKAPMFPTDTTGIPVSDYLTWGPFKVRVLVVKKYNFCSKTNSIQLDTHGLNGKDPKLNNYCYFSNRLQDSTS